MSALEPRIAHLGSSLAVEYDKRLMVISGRANPALAGRIAEKLGVVLGGVTLRTFSNGEVYCRFEESIRGADVFLVQPTCGNPQTGVTANDALMELLLMVDAAAGASAHRVIAVTPWYGYSRQDKKSLGREPISARLVARMLETAGADRGIDHQQQLHQRVVRRDPGLGVAAGRLDDEQVRPADRLLVAAVDLAVRERPQRDAAERDAELLRDPAREAGVRAAGDHHQALVVLDGERRAEVGDPGARIQCAHWTCECTTVGGRVHFLRSA